jgi:hypothetical protein
MLTENQYSRQGRPPYFYNFVVLTMASTSGYRVSTVGLNEEQV